MKYLGREFRIKKIGHYPPLALGIELSVCQLAQRIGLKVPDVIQISADAIGSEAIPVANDLSHPDLESLLFPSGSRFLENLAKLIVFDYALANVNLIDQAGNFIRDADNYPCYSERHPKNILWDGTDIWYIDFGHVFCRHLALFGAVNIPERHLLDTLPPQFHEGFLVAARDSLQFAKEATGDITERVKSILGSFVSPRLFHPNLWLPADVCLVMERIFGSRLGYLRMNL